MVVVRTRPRPIGNAEILQYPSTPVRHVSGVAVDDDRAIPGEPVSDRYAKASGEVVITRTSRPERRIPRPGHHVRAGAPTVRDATCITFSSMCATSGEARL